MDIRPDIGTRVIMPKRPAHYLGGRHPDGGSAGRVVEHLPAYTDSVRVIYDKNPQFSVYTLWQWLEPEPTTNDATASGATP